VIASDSDEPPVIATESTLEVRVELAPVVLGVQSWNFSSDDLGRFPVVSPVTISPRIDLSRDPQNGDS
jgi:hypothetical protein